MLVLKSKIMHTGVVPIVSWGYPIRLSLIRFECEGQQGTNDHWGQVHCKDKGFMSHMAVAQL